MEAGPKFQSLAASILKLWLAIFSLAESLKTLFCFCLKSCCSLAGLLRLYGSNDRGDPSTWTIFQTSTSFIWAANWLVESKLNFFSIEAMLILSLIFDPFKTLSSLFWVSCSSFIGPFFLSSLSMQTFVHSCSPYRSLLTHRLWTMLMILFFGICRWILPMTNRRWLSADIRDLNHASPWFGGCRCKHFPVKMFTKEILIILKLLNCWMFYWNPYFFTVNK